MLPTSKQSVWLNTLAHMRMERARRNSILVRRMIPLVRDKKSSYRSQKNSAVSNFSDTHFLLVGNLIIENHRTDGHEILNIRGHCCQRKTLEYAH